MFEERKDPPFFEERLGCFVFAMFESESTFPFLQVQGKGARSTAAFLRVRSIPFIGQEVIQGAQEKGTKSAALGLQCSQGSFLKKTGKKILGQVLGFGPGQSATAHISVERIPVVQIKPGKGVARRVGIRSRNLQDRSPMCRLKFSSPGIRLHDPELPIYS